jgi:hypothetical protein
VVTRGGIRGNGRQLADYLLTQGDNDKVAVFDIRGTSQPDDLRKSLIEMSLTAELSGRTKKGLYHVVINPDPEASYRMAAADWFRAAEIMEQQAGFTGQKRVMVLHEKKGRIHAHVAWERYNHETGKMIPNKHSRLAQNRARIQMEQEFSHTRTPEHNIKRPELRKLITELWQQTPDGNSFVKALSKKGITAAKGETRRPFMAVDDTGRSFNLVRELKGVDTKEVRERLKGISIKPEKQVIEVIRDRQKANRVDLLQQEAERLKLERQQQIDALKQKFGRQQGRDHDRG